MGAGAPGESAPQIPGYRVLGINWANLRRKCPADSGAPSSEAPLGVGNGRAGSTDDKARTGVRVGFGSRDTDNLKTT